MKTLPVLGLTLGDVAGIGPEITLRTPLDDVPIGELNPAAGDGSYRFVVAACDLAKEGAIDGIVTAPLNKATMHG